MSGGAAPLRPALQRAVQALSSATTPAAAYAAMDALDVECMQAFRSDAAAVVTHGSLDEEDTLSAALLAGVSAATLAALLRSTSLRRGTFASHLLYHSNLTRPALRLRAKTLLKDGNVLDALLSAISVADRLMTAGGVVEHTVTWRDADEAGVIGAVLPPMQASGLLDFHLCALNTCLHSWSPHLAERLVATPKREELFAVLLKRYTPLLRRSTDHGSLPLLHGTVIRLLQTLTASEPTKQLLSTPGQQFLPRIVRALVAGLVRQADLARTRPLGDFLGREVSDACSVLVNCVAAADDVSAASCAPRAALLCDEGAPAALFGLLHEDSVLLRRPLSGEHAEALFIATQVVHELMRYPMARAQLLHAHEPSGASPLLRVLAVVALYVAPPAGCPSAAGLALKAFRLAQGLTSELAAGDDVPRGSSKEFDLVFAGLFDFEPLAVQQLARRCGWDGRPGAAIAAFGQARVRGGDRSALEADFVVSTGQTGTVGPLHTEQSGRCRCAGCERQERANEGPFKTCGRCRTVHYCCVACQTEHWPVHKRVCKR